MDNRMPTRRGRPQRASDSERTKPEGELFPKEQDEGVEIAQATAPVSVKPTSGVTGIRSRYPARIILYAPSGKRYEWGGAGDTVGVSDEDVTFVLSKNKPGPSGCCGGGEKIVFETV